MTEKQNTDMLASVEKLYFISAVLEKERPPVSPVPTETRELARRSLAEFNKTVERARRKAAESGAKVEIDGSRLSGVKSGDIWSVTADGSLCRSFECNEGLLEGLLQRRSERVADPDRDLDLETLGKLLAYAQWAPNATNEQPNRVLVYRKDHPSMQKIGELMQKALYERIIPRINIRNYILQKKTEIPDFLPGLSLQDLQQMDEKEFAAQEFEQVPAPLEELPQTADKLLERGKVVFHEGRYYLRRQDGGRGPEFSMADLLQNDRTFAKGMGTFFLKFKNTHPYLVVIFRKWHYTSLMTETLSKYGIVLPAVGEEFLDAGFYADHLALAARGLGLSGVVKTGPLDLAKDELTELFISDLQQLRQEYEKMLADPDNLPQRRISLVKTELPKITLLHDGLRFGLEVMRSQAEGRPLRRQLLVALKRGEVFVPALFFQVGYPLPQAAERVMDPRQGKDPLREMVVMMPG